MSNRTHLVVMPGDGIGPEITAATLILKADADEALKKQNEEVAGLLKSGKIVHIKGAGHNVRREGKEETIQVLSAFLSSVVSRQSSVVASR